MIRVRCVLARVPRRQASTLPGAVGIIGLGNMGAPMAKNALKACEKVIVHDTRSTVVHQLTAFGAVGARSLADFKGAHTVITMLPSNATVQHVYQGNGGLLEVMQPGTIFIDSSTISPSLTRSLAVEAEKKGCRLFDAPVSGGVLGAVNGTLTFMVGAPEADLALVRSVLQTMGKNIVACGQIGNGQVAKLCNNLVLAISMVAVSEGMNLGVKLGMDKQVLASIFSTSTARCWSADTYNPCPGVLPNVPASRNFENGFGVDLMLKDLGLALQEGAQANQLLPATSLAEQLYRFSSQSGFGTKDFGFIHELLKNNGAEIEAALNAKK
eukprot:c39549_g1_i1.p1 GENE.c39549_g1_i1~~c39549_g1_i1.p1  ORF type:complete len:326 (-),score=69.09 c39549_g1_i1:30-1007(-)